MAACAVVDCVCAAFDRTWPRPNLPAHVKTVGTEECRGNLDPSPGLLACFAQQLDCRQLSGTALTVRKPANEVPSAVDAAELCSTVAGHTPSVRPVGPPRVAPSHRVVMVPTMPPTGGMRDPVFILDFYKRFSAPSFDGSSGALSVSASGVAVLYRLVPIVGSTAAPRGRGGNATDFASWQIDTVWTGRDGAGFGTGIAMNADATADDMRCSVLWECVVKMLRDEPIGFPRSAAAKGARGAMAWCCWVDLERYTARTIGHELEGGNTREGREAGGQGPPQLEGTTWEENGRPRPP